MITKFITTFFLIISLQLLFVDCFSQTYSQIDYTLGSSLEVQTGADVCANEVLFINGGTWSGGGTICSGPLPVTMLSFAAVVVSRNVRLQWVTGSEINNSGFEVQRRQEKQGAEWQMISFVQGHGTTNEPKTYAYEDKKLQVGSYRYRLKQIDFNGNFEFFECGSVTEVLKPKEFSMSQNYPNPSNPKSKIDYEVPVNGKVSLKVYNLLGQQVLDLLNETKEAGYYTVEFDGSNLSSGVYFYRIISEGEGLSFSKTLKMVLVK